MSMLSRVLMASQRNALLMQFCLRCTHASILEVALVAELGGRGATETGTLAKGFEKIQLY